MLSPVSNMPATFDYIEQEVISALQYTKFVKTVIRRTLLVKTYIIINAFILSHNMMLLLIVNLKLVYHPLRFTSESWKRLHCDSYTQNTQ
jgi:hypothetical protein